MCYMIETYNMIITIIFIVIIFSSHDSTKFCHMCSLISKYTIDGNPEVMKKNKDCVYILNRSDNFETIMQLWSECILPTSFCSPYLYMYK